MDDARLVRAELGAALAELGDGRLESCGHRAGLRVGHEALATEDHAELADVLHHVGSRDRDVEVEPAALHLFDELVGTDEGGAGVESLLLLFGLAEDQDLLFAAELVRKDDRVANRLALFEVEPDVHLDGLVELGEVEVLHQGAGGGGLVFFLGVVLLDRLLVLLAVLHFEYSVSTPMERAVPAMIRLAASMSLASVGIFCFRDRLELVAGSLPTFCL